MAGTEEKMREIYRDRENCRNIERGNKGLRFNDIEAVIKK